MAVSADLCSFCRENNDIKMWLINLSVSVLKKYKRCNIEC